MPTYDYACDKCGHEFEFVHGMMETFNGKCPKCGHKKAHKIFNSSPHVTMDGIKIKPVNYGKR
jgi:putative FmdB family regulatory protein